MKITLLGLTTFFIYAIATILICLHLQHAGRQRRYFAAQIPALFAATLHTLLLIYPLQLDQLLQFDFFTSLSLCAWIIVILLLTASLRWPIASLGVLVYPMAGICALLYSLSLSPPDQAILENLIVPPPMLMTHIVASLFAYSLLSLASLQAVVLAIQHSGLHHHKQNLFIRTLPSLQTMETLLFRLLWVGFSALTVSLISGALVIENWLTHKVIFSLAAWVTFSILLTGRQLAGWRGRQATRFTLTGISFLMLAFFGSKLVFEFILRR